MTAEHRPVVCTLSDQEASAQIFEWDDLQTHLTGKELLPNGVRMSFPARYEKRLRNVAEREAECCAFLDIATHVDGDHVSVEITSSNPDALPVIALLAGVTTHE